MSEPLSEQFVYGPFVHAAVIMGDGLITLSVRTDDSVVHMCSVVLRGTRSHHYLLSLSEAHRRLAGEPERPLDYCVYTD